MEKNPKKTNEVETLMTKIQSQYGLCTNCLGRQVDRADGLKSEKIRVTLDKSSCYICQGLLERVPEFSAKLIDTLKDYDFETFAVGVSLDKDFYEREDEVRSKFKLRGGQTLRSEIAKKLSGFVADETKAKYVFRKPDLTMVVSLPQSLVTILPKPLVVFGKYTKSERGIRQKKKVCENCSGLGCSNCSNTGEVGKSIESLLGKELLSSFEGKKIRFTWVGGEDSNSLVLGNGRPFFATITEARKRKLSLKEKTKLVDGIRAKIYKILDSKPQASPMFRTVALLRVMVKEPPSALKKGKFVARCKVEVSSITGKVRPITRKVYSIKVEDISDSRVSLKIAFEGGLSLKNFVSGGKGSTYPSLKDLLGAEVAIDEDSPFDILNVELHARPVP